jgi:hypothetical protein
MSQYYDPSPTSEFYFDVANRNYPNHSCLTIFGAGVSTTTLSTVWGKGGLYSYPTAASVMKVSSSSGSDLYGTGGAQSVFIQGLDANWNAVSETVNLNGQNAVNTSKTYIRINRVTVVAGAVNIGNIHVGIGTVSAGVPATTYGFIKIGNGESIQSMYSIPAGHTAYLIDGSIASGTTAANKYIVGRLMARPFGGVLITSMITSLATGQNTYNFKAPIRIEEKSDIEARALSSSGTDEVATHFQFILVKE